jgi:oligoendopeptidase F
MTYFLTGPTPILKESALMPKSILDHAPVRAAATAHGTDSQLGTLPGWNLDDLYPGPESAEFKTDLAAARTGAQAFEARWKGKIAEAAATTGDDGLGAVIEAYEKLEELMGRIISYAGLAYFTNTSDPALELNRIDDTLIEESLGKDPRAARYTPWIHDLRLDRPFQLEDRIEQLFHEKSMTGHAAWNRLFDETMSSLEFTIDDQALPLEVTLSLLQDADGARRKKAGLALAETFKANLRTFTLITNTLAKDKEISDRWRGFEDIADSRHLANRVERPVVDALGRRCASQYPKLSHRYYKMKAGWLGLDKMNSGTATRRCRTPRDDRLGHGQEHGAGCLCGLCAGDGRHRAPFFDERWIDAPSRRASRPAPSPTRPCRRRTPTCWSTTSASRAT